MFVKKIITDTASVQKKYVLFSTLVIIANGEDNKAGFTILDGLLAQLSDVYRRSRERLAMLERHSLEPPVENLYTDRDLKAALKEARSFKCHTTINTNLFVLEAIDFSQPFLPSDWDAVLTPPPETSASIFNQSDHRSIQHKWHLALCALGGVLLLATVTVGIFRMRERRAKGSHGVA